MIMTKKEDRTYKQVGFIYRNDEIDVSGEVPVDFKTTDGIIGDYTIKGNAYQSDGVSPDTPQEVKAVGDRTGNLFDKDKQAGIIYVTETVTRYGVEIPVSAGTYSIVGGTNKLFVKKKHGTTYGTAIDYNTSAERIYTYICGKN